MWVLSLSLFLYLGRLFSIANYLALLRNFPPISLAFNPFFLATFLLPPLVLFPAPFLPDSHTPLSSAIYIGTSI